jgi:hypothetical protein
VSDPIAGAEADAICVATFYATMKANVEDPYDVLQLTQEYMAQLLAKRAEENE